MTDLSALRGFVPQLACVPTAIYFHENQFAYPDNPRISAERNPSVEPQLLSIYTALCADQLIFNSQFNRHSFVEGARQLLRKLPDHVPSGIVQTLESRARVIPVPLAQELFCVTESSHSTDSTALNIVWNHRWEFDKGPALLLAIMQKLIDKGVRFRLHVLGQRFRQTPEEFAALAQLMQSHYQRTGIAPGQWGFIESRTEYNALLASSDIVLSTATHDFQGLALLEATALGCTPLAPHCMAYPEYLPPENLYPIDQTPQQCADHAAKTLERWANDKLSLAALPQVDVTRFSPQALIGAYSTLFSQLCAKP